MIEEERDDSAAVSQRVRTIAGGELYINIDEAMAMLTKAYLKECDKIGLSRSRAQRQEDLDSALSCFYIRACKLGHEMRNPQAIAVYAIRDIIFRENRKRDRERWTADAEDAVVSVDEDDINDIVEYQFPEARQAVDTFSFKVFLRRLMRANHDAAEVADSFDILFKYYKKNAKNKKKSEK